LRLSFAADALDIPGSLNCLASLHEALIDQV
jgi:hypothetical protein